MNELDLFAAAVAAPDPAERTVLLDRACAGRPELRRRLDRLIAAHFQPNELLDPPTAEQHADGRTDADTPADDAGGVVAGRYKLLQLLGEGGMGTVWMAEQTEPVRRRVAVKLIRTDQGHSRTILTRFEAERQAIALMDHPHIAKLLDAGTAESGAPYFVMELVKGVPLTAFCDTYKLSIPDRLRLFVQVCSAVQHAHQKGVIHRDLKPTNVLVESHDGRPVPKVIDFGLAKATTGLRLSEKTLFTAFGSVLGTPLYMAPEQANFNAIDVDTRADVYALGVILYELLTGTTPIMRETMKRAALDEMLKLICEQEAPTPSSRLSSSDAAPSVAANRQTEPAKLGRFVKGELDWIVLKSLSKERDRRYETASGFAKDVERFLNHEPVSAGPPSAAYRVRKFARRNRPQVIAASVVLVALVAGIAGTTFGFMRARHQERMANESAVAERKAKDEADEKRKEAEANEAEANAVVRFFEGKVLAAGRPKGEAGGLGHDVSLRNAVRAGVPSLATSFKDQPLVEARLRDTLGGTFHYLGDDAQAAEQFELARALFHRHRGPDHPATLGSVNNLAASYAALNRRAEAVGLLEEVLAAQRRVLPPDHPDTLKTMTNLANSYAALNRRDDALRLREEVLAARRGALPPDHPDTLRSMQSLATSYAAQGRHDVALKLDEEVLAARRRVLPPDHPDTLLSMNNLAKSYASVNRHAEALRLREEVLAAQERVLPPDHPNTLRSVYNLAKSYTTLDRHAEALKLHERALAARKRVLPPDHPDTFLSMISLADSYAALGRHAEALPPIDEVLAKGDRPGVDPRLITVAIALRMQCCRKLGDLANGRATAEMWERLGRTDAVSLYAAGSFRAVTAALRAKANGPDPARLAKEEADKAMAWLAKAVAAGWTDAAAMRKDADLDFLRDRDDFKKLVADLDKAQPVPPEAK